LAACTAARAGALAVRVAGAARGAHRASRAHELAHEAFALGRRKSRVGAAPQRPRTTR
jgi:hypothetical protein